MKKKKLLIVGNKDIKSKITTLVNSSDFVVRYNKLDNSDKTGFRCDLYGAMFDPEHFLKNISDDKLQIIKSYDNVLSYSDRHLAPLDLDSSSDKVTLIDEEAIRNYFGKLIKMDEPLDKFQSMVVLILYCILTYSDEYDIYATAFDLNRNYLKKESTWHIYLKEENSILTNLMIQHKFHYIQVR